MAIGAMPESSGFAPGDRVMGLLMGGGYAEYISLPITVWLRFKAMSS